MDNDWNTMDTFPKDGKIVRVLLSDGTETDACFHENFYRACIMLRGSVSPLFHWAESNSLEI